MKKRIIAAVMAAVMCFSVTSCTDSSDKKQWQITEEEREQLVELSCKAVQNGETLEITLACDEDLFKDDIAKSSIAVNVYEYQPKEKTPRLLPRTAKQIQILQQAALNRQTSRRAASPRQRKLPITP